MRRRDFIALVTGAAVASSRAALAQSPPRVFRIGTLTVGPPIPPTQGTGKMLIDGLAKRGFKLGDNLAYEARGAAGKSPSRRI